MEKYDQDLKALNDKYKELKVKIMTTNFKDWQNVLQKAIGFSDEELLSGALKSGSVAVDSFKTKLEKEFKNLQEYSNTGLINISKLDLAQQKLEKINAVIKAMRDSGEWGANENTTKKMQELQASATQELYIEQLNNMKEQLAILKDQTGELEKQAQIKAYMDSGYSEKQAKDLIATEKLLTDEKLKQSDVWAYLTQQVSTYFTSLGITKNTAEMFAKTLIDIVNTEVPNQLVSSFEAIGTALAKGSDVGKALKQQYEQFIASILKSISITCIQAGLALIAQSGWAGVPMAVALFALGGATGIASAFTSAKSEATSEEQERLKQLELLKSLNRQYESLLTAIKEEEDYYIRQKSLLTANARRDSYQVNDMILTPQGKFSTHPDDYIIATKNPQSLGGGAVFNMKINNTASNDVDVQANAVPNSRGGQDILVTISRKIASDVSRGANGWDSALSSRSSRLSGRSLSL